MNLPDSPETMRRLIVALTARVEDQEAMIVELRARIDSLRKLRGKELGQSINRIITTRADITKLRGALKPLADEAFKKMVGGAGHLIDDAYRALADTKGGAA